MTMENIPCCGVISSVSFYCTKNCNDLENDVAYYYCNSLFLFDVQRTFDEIETKIVSL